MAMSRKVKNKRWGWLLLVIIPLVLVAVSLGAAVTALSLQGSLDDYKSPYGVPLSTGEPGERLAQRVVVVVVDGLRADVSRQMPFLESLRTRGAWTTLTTGQPSFSKPGYAVLSTGTWQEINGVTMNSHPGQVPVQTIFSVAREKGLKTALMGYTYWGEINPAVDYALIGDYPDGDIYARSRGSLEAGEADLTYVHFSAVDNAGHTSGGAASAAYLEAARQVDGMLAGLASCLDLSRDVLVITADHGQLSHNNRGGSGHGGWEHDATTVPLVLVGSHITPGEFAPSLQVDVVPTVAALLGLPAPAQSVGRILWPALAVDEKVRADTQIKRAAQSVEFARAYVQVLDRPQASSAVAATGAAAVAATEAVTSTGTVSPREMVEAMSGLEEARSKQQSGDYGGAFTAASLSIDKAQRAMSVARARAIWKARWPRLPLVAVPLLFLGLAAWKWRRSLFTTLAWGAAYLLVFHVVYTWVCGDVYSLSVFPSSSMATMFRLFGIPAYMALGAVLGGVLWAGTGPGTRAGTGRLPSGAQMFEGRLNLVWLTEKALLAPYLVLGMLVVAGLFWDGNRVTFYLPGFRFQFLYFCALLQLLFLLPGTLVLPLSTWLGVRPRPLPAGTTTGDVGPTNADTNPGNAGTGPAAPDPQHASRTHSSDDGQLPRYRPA